jgi:hypothetical protein
MDAIKSIEVYTRHRNFLLANCHFQVMVSVKFEVEGQTGGVLAEGGGSVTCVGEKPAELDILCYEIRALFCNGLRLISVYTLCFF